MEPDPVLITGGSGYLGLHLLQALSQAAPPPRLAFTYFSHPPPASLFLAFPHVLAFKVDLESGDGLDAISGALGPDTSVDKRVTVKTPGIVSKHVGESVHLRIVLLSSIRPRLVINCAALSVPRECESNPSIAMAVNVPHALVHWLLSFDGVQPPLLIHISTDQVYEGTKSFYKEDDETKPVNVYGKSKLDAEQFIVKRWPNYAILRSSIIFGPQPLVPVQKSLLIQWTESVLSNGKGADFFHDEYRCPVFVKDVVKVVELVMKKEASGVGPLQLLLNVGGPQRLSRAEMAEVVADCRGFGKSLINYVSTKSANRGVPSPADISMDVNRLTLLFPVVLTSFKVGVELTLTKEQ